jgi:hypothetical protein
MRHPADGKRWRVSSRNAGAREGSASATRYCQRIRLPGWTSPVPSRLSIATITRGPRVNTLAPRSGSRSITSRIS